MEKERIRFIKRCYCWDCGKIGFSLVLPFPDHGEGEKMRFIIWESTFPVFSACRDDLLLENDVALDMKELLLVLLDEETSKHFWLQCIDHGFKISWKKREDIFQMFDSLLCVQDGVILKRITDFQEIKDLQDFDFGWKNKGFCVAPVWKEATDFEAAWQDAIAGGGLDFNIINKYGIWGIK